MGGKLQLLIESNCPVVVPVDQWEITYETVESPLREDMVTGLLNGFDRAVYERGDERLKDEWSKVKEQWKGWLLETEKRLRVYGPAQVVDQRNGNGRIYPASLWDRVLREDSPFMQRLKARQVLGELEHPAEANTKLPRVSHLVERVERKGNVIYAGHLIFRTPPGQVIEELYRCGVAPGVSSRAIGSVRHTAEGDVVEEEGFVLDTFDFVYLPSVAIARPLPVQEGRRAIQYFPADFVVAVDGRGQLVAGPATALVPPAGCTVKRLGEMSGGWLEEYQIRLFNGKEKIVMAEQAVLNVDRIKAEANAVAQARSVLGEVPVQLEGLSFDDMLKSYDRLTEVRKSLELYKDGAEVAEVLGRVEERLASLRNAMEESRKREKDRLDRLVEEHLDRILGDDDGSSGGKDDLDVVRDLDDGYREKYEAACRLGEELLAEAKKIKRERDRLKKKCESSDGELDRVRELEHELEVAYGLGEELTQEARRRIRAMEELLKALVERYRKEGIVRYLLGMAQKYPALKDSVEFVARKCSTMQEAKELVESIIKPLADRGDYPSDLPPVGYQGSSTGTSPARLRESGGDLMRLVVNRIEGRKGF